VISRES
jgi:hypothetical protein